MKKKNILVEATGGLGNQIFCYMFYRKLCLEYSDIHFKMDLSNVMDKRYTGRYELYYAFSNLNMDIASWFEILEKERKITFSFRGKGSRLIRTFVDRLNHCVKDKKREYTEIDYIDHKCFLEYKDLVEINYFSGFWQDVNYFIPHLDILRKELRFHELQDEKNCSIRDAIRSQMSVSVHVRRGDYVGEILDILDTNYYKKIIDHVLSIEKNAHFYFFSNDSDYIEKEYAWLENKTIVKNNTGINSYKDMQLMSMCKINIIANSTFSLCAALLNENTAYKAFYPSYFTKNEKMRTINLPNFQMIEVDINEK